MKESNAFVKAFPIQWILTIVVAVLLWIIVDSKWAYSFILGSATSLMMMSMMYKSTKKVLKEQNPRSQIIVVRDYVFRYLFYALILVVSGLSDNFEIIAVAIGIISFKASLYISIFFDKRGANDD